MTFYDKGHSPRRFHAVRPLCRTGVGVAVLVASLALNATAAADPDVPLTLAEAGVLALEHEPGQVALSARASALAEQAIAAGQLPDPTMRMGLANYPVEAGSFTTEGMTQAQVGFRQAFPPGETRAVHTRQFQSLALALNEQADARGRDVLSTVRTAWLETWYWARAREIVAATRPFFADLVTITESLYSVGIRDQQDVLRADLELSRLDDRLIKIDRQAAGARALLSQWVGKAAGRALPPKLPGFEPLPPIEAMHSRLDEHPAIAAQEARIAANGAAVDLAHERYKPGWAIDVGYGFRGGELPSGDPRSDMISVSFSMDLPLFRKNRQDRTLAAALSERRAASETREEVIRRLRSQLDAELARWQDLGRRLALYDERILPEASEQADAALLAYQSEAGDFADVMRAWIDDLNVRLDYQRLQVDRAQSYAVLANLGGLSE